MPESKPKLLLLCLIVSVLLGGCASPTRIRSADINPATATPQGYVVLRQQEIKTSIVRQDSSAIAGQFGLIGSLVGSAIDAGVNSKRSKQVEQAAAKIRNALLDYRPAVHLAAQLQEQLASLQRTTPVNFEVKHVTDPDEPKQWAKSANQDTILVDCDYALTPAYNGVKICVLVTWHRPGAGEPAKGAASNLPPVIYQNVLSSVRYFPKLPGATVEERAGKLAEDNAKIVRETLDLAQADIAALLAYDLGVSTRPENAVYKAGKGDVQRSIDVNRFSPIVSPGYIERTTDDRVWVRSITGDLGADVR